jgi:4-cresol dehydrogenase (hydroxylating)
MMDSVVDPADPYWQAVGAIKQALDPNNVIAPGRYSP